MKNQNQNQNKTTQRKQINLKTDLFSKSVKVLQSCILKDKSDHNVTYKVSTKFSFPKNRQPSSPWTKENSGENSQLFNSTYSKK